MNLTIPRLQQIANQIAHGNPWWGLAVANEYLDTSAPMHRAFVAKVKKRLGESACRSELATKLINGSCLETLSEALKYEVGPLCHLPKNHPLKQITFWQRRNHRRTVRADRSVGRPRPYSQCPRPLARFECPGARTHGAIRLPVAGHRKLPRRLAKPLSKKSSR